MKAADSRSPAQTPNNEASAAWRMRLYEAALSNTPDLVYVFDLQHRFIFANEALLKMWGRKWDEAIGRTCLELGYEPWHAAMHDREIEQVIASKRSVRGEVPFSGTGGRRVYDYIFSPVFGPGGEVEAIAGTTRDVTERQQMITALRESEEFSRTVLESSPDSVKVLDTEGRLELMNRHGLEMMELDGFHLVRGQEWASLWPEHERDTVRQAVAAVRRGETVRFLSFRPTMRGTPKWWDLIVTPVLGATGEVLRIVCVGRDVTAQKQVEEQLAEAKRAAEAASKAKDDFLAALSHELRTPLNPVLMIASEAALDEMLPAVVRADFAAIERNVLMEARLIDDLLDLTRISHGKLRLDRRVIDARESLQAAMGFIRPDLRTQDLHLSLDLDAEPCWVDADPVRLQQVFWNVLRNAVKFSPGGSGIRVRTRRENRLIVEIQDQGVGISAEDLGTIFDAFKQASNANLFGGLGLGLAITRSLVEHHGGSISAHSDGIGRGALFRIEIPLVPGPVKEAAASAPASLPTQASRVRRILVVEDHEPTRATLHRLLARRGHSVSLAARLAEARGLLAEGEFDVLLTDLGLPDGDGSQLMRELPQSATAPIAIAMSGYGMEEDVQRSLKAGFAAHLTKPIDIDSLYRLLLTI